VLTPWALNSELASIWGVASLIHHVSPLGDRLLTGGERVAVAYELGSELGLEGRTLAGILGVLDQVRHLIGVGVIVVEQPGTIRIADIRIASRPYAPVGLEVILPEGGDGHEERGTLLLTVVASEEPRKILAFNRVGYGNACQ
jgi:hypothetical protein